jgi:hypothetical protein
MLQQRRKIQSIDNMNGAVAAAGAEDSIDSGGRPAFAESRRVLSASVPPKVKSFLPTVSPILI